MKGVGSTTPDDVRMASSTSKSQLYNHFLDTLALIHAVIEVQSQSVLAREGPPSPRANFSGFRRWRDALVQSIMLQDGSYGCALGAMSTELSDKDDPSRKALALAFEEWQELLVETLTPSARSRDTDAVRRPAETLNRCAGGPARSIAHNPLLTADALDMALDRIDCFATR